MQIKVKYNNVYPFLKYWEIPLLQSEIDSQNEDMSLFTFDENSLSFSNKHIGLSQLTDKIKDDLLFVHDIKQELDIDNINELIVITLHIALSIKTINDYYNEEQNYLSKIYNIYSSLILIKENEDAVLSFTSKNKPGLSFQIDSLSKELLEEILSKILTATNIEATPDHESKLDYLTTLPAFNKPIRELKRETTKYRRKLESFDDSLLTRGTLALRDYLVDIGFKLKKDSLISEDQIRVIAKIFNATGWNKETKTKEDRTYLKMFRSNLKKNVEKMLR